MNQSINHSLLILIVLPFVIFCAFPLIGHAQYKYDSTLVKIFRWSPEPSYVKGVAQPSLAINDGWKFTIADTIHLATVEKLSFKDMAVPGEWVMQCYKVENKEFGVYKKTFLMPHCLVKKGVRLVLTLEGFTI